MAYQLRLGDDPLHAQRVAAQLAAAAVPPPPPPPPLRSSARPASAGKPGVAVDNSARGRFRPVAAAVANRPLPAGAPRVAWAEADGEAISEWGRTATGATVGPAAAAEAAEAEAVEAAFASDEDAWHLLTVRPADAAAH